MGLLTVRAGSWWFLGGSLAVDAIGALATVSLTAVLALPISLGVLSVFGRHVHKTLLIGVPLLLAAAVLLWPAFQERWATQFDPHYSWGALPESWQGRLSNITDVFWPQIQREWVFGVSPVPKPAELPEDDWRSVENQILYMWYQGGILYMIAYIVFMGVVLPTIWWSLRLLRGPALAVGRAAFIAWLLMLVLGLFDLHFNLAVEAEVAWMLLALTVGAAARAAGAAEAAAPAPPVLAHAA